MIYRFGPGVGRLNYLAVPRVGIFEFLFVRAVGQYLTSTSLRETGTECSSYVAHTRYILQSWRSCKMRKRCVNFLFFFLFVLCISLIFLYFNVSVFHVVQMKTNRKKCCRFDARNLIRIDLIHVLCCICRERRLKFGMHGQRTIKKFIVGVLTYEELLKKGKMSSFYR